MRFTGIITRDLRLALRQRSDAAMIVLFFVLTAALFPFGVGPEANQLAAIAPGVIWVTALLSVLLSLERLFPGRLRGRQPRTDGAVAGPAGIDSSGQGDRPLADHRFAPSLPRHR